MKCHRNMMTVNSEIKKKPSFTEHKSKSEIYYEFLQENPEPEEHLLINKNEPKTKNKEKQLPNETDDDILQDPFRDDSSVSYTEETIQKIEKSENEQQIDQQRQKKKYILPRRKCLCHICGKVIKDMKNHVRIHSDDKEFQCKICNSKYRQEGNLKAHMKIHNNIK